MATTNPSPRSEPTGELIRRLIENVQGLVDKQIEMVKQELREDLRQLAGAAKTLGIGLAFLLLAGLCLFHFIFLGIDRLTGGWGWAAALVCTLLFAAVGAIFAKRGMGQVRVQPLARTRETLKEDAEWAKHRLTPNGKSSPSETTSPQPSRS